jgi:WD40 repeat protein
VAVAHLDGRPVVVTGGGRFDLAGPDLESMGGGVRVWDIRTGRKIGKTLTGHGLGVTSLTTVATESGLLTVSSSEEGELRAWNLTSGVRVAAIEVGYNGDMGAGLLSGRPVAVTGGHDDFVQVWDLLSGEQLGPSLSGIKPVARALAAVEVEGRATVVTGSNDRTSRIWDLARGEQLGDHLLGHLQAVTEIEGTPVAVTSMANDRVRVWDLTRAVR